MSFLLCIFKHPEKGSLGFSTGVKEQLGVLTGSQYTSFAVSHPELSQTRLSLSSQWEAFLSGSKSHLIVGNLSKARFVVWVEGFDVHPEVNLQNAGAHGKPVRSFLDTWETC